MISSVLAEGRQVVVAIRDTPISQGNPYTVAERQVMLQTAFSTEIATGDMQVIVIPDIDEICHGRKVGWSVREIKLDADMEAISATGIRANQAGRVVWLTGNSGSGKTTVANLLRPELENSIVLDGDEMRGSISLGTGFSHDERLAHNKRVARLARVLAVRGSNVIVSVIAPSEAIRQAVKDELLGVSVTWVYIKRTLSWGDERPYTPPASPHLTVDHDVMTPTDSKERILAYLEKDNANTT
jgi:adenylylsulfate kinase-like enzyme